MIEFSDAKEQIKHEFRDWSLAHFVFDACLTGLLTVIVGWLSQMPWPWLVSLAIMFGGTITSGIVIWQRYLRRRAWTSSVPFNQEEAIWRSRTDAVFSVTKRIYEVIDMIPRYPNAGMDWHPKTAAALRAMLRPDIVEKYTECFVPRGCDQDAAIEFLRGLALVIEPSDLRTAEVPKPNAA